MFGFNGMSARINLTEGTISREVVSEDTFRRFLGGRGIGSMILFRECPQGADPLSPENPLVFSAGVLTGTVVPGGTRYHTSAKSPLTGIYGEANAGGKFGCNLRRAGYDFIVLEGASKRPVYIYMDEDSIEIRSAEKLWGLSIPEVDDLLRKEHGPAASVAAIGPSGEKKIPIASIISDKHRVAARTGIGAVMGSKQVKAIVVRGRKDMKYAHPDTVRLLSQKIAASLRQNPAKMAVSKYGTSGGVAALNEAGVLPTQNFLRGTFEGYARISGVTMAASILSTTYSCPGCPIRCIRGVKIDSGEFSPVRPDAGGPEYETVGAFGSLCCNDNLESIARAHYLCNTYGIDTISAGNIIAWAMECFERGILSAAELDGVELHWGNARGLIEILIKMCKGEGVGNILAQGVRRASQVIGRGSDGFAIHVKGLEMALHEPRGKVGQGLGYIIGARGAAHTEVMPDWPFEKPNAIPELGLVNPISRFDKSPEKARLVVKTHDLTQLLNMCGGCIIVFQPWGETITLSEFSELLSAITGWDCSVDELMRTAERANNLARAFNVREGVRRADDRLPTRFAFELPEGASAGHTLTSADVATLLDAYYEGRGWTPDGVPMRSTLNRLGLADVATELFSLTGEQQGRDDE